MPNSIDFYKKIFLHVITARVIVPWYWETSFNSLQNDETWFKRAYSNKHGEAVLL